MWAGRLKTRAERWRAQGSWPRVVGNVASQVAAVIAFLASPVSVSINGESIACGGGIPGIIRY
jgi:hypothetical protein